VNFGEFRGELGGILRFDWEGPDVDIVQRPNLMGCKLRFLETKSGNSH
jgi:hypothetical protein